MPKKPLISIIMPAYNAQQYIREAIFSVLSQSYTYFELIIINDCSTDKTQSILQSLSDSRIRIISLKKNKGVSAARNVGIKKAKGKYITFLDADDYMSTHTLRNYYTTLTSNPKFGVCYSKYSIRGGSLEIPVPVKTPEGNIHTELLKSFGCIGFGSNGCIKKEEIIFFDESMRFGEDWDFHIRLSKKSTYVCTNSFDLYYRKHPKSASTQFFTQFFESKKILKKQYFVGHEDIKKQVWITMVKHQAHNCLNRYTIFRPHNFALGCYLYVLYAYLYSYRKIEGLFV